MDVVLGEAEDEEVVEEVASAAARARGPALEDLQKVETPSEMPAASSPTPPLREVARETPETAAVAVQEGLEPGLEPGSPGGSPTAEEGVEPATAERKPLATQAEELARIRAREAVEARSPVAGVRPGHTAHTSFVSSPPAFPKRPLGYFKEVPGPTTGRRIHPRDLEVPAAGPGEAPQLITSRGIQSLTGPPDLEEAPGSDRPLAQVSQNPRTRASLNQPRGTSKSRGAWNRKFLEKYDLQKHNIF